jgi:hypothetical protein
MDGWLNEKERYEHERFHLEEKDAKRVVYIGGGWVALEHVTSDLK